MSDQQTTQAPQPEAAPAPAAPAAPRRLADYANHPDAPKDPAEVKAAFEKAAALEAELHQAKEALQAAESRLDPRQFREELRSDPQQALSKIDVDFNTVLDQYLQRQVSQAPPEPVEEPDPQSKLAAEVQEIKQQLAYRQRQEIEQRELLSISADLESVDAPALKALAAAGSPVGQWILQAAVQAVSQGYKINDYKALIGALEQKHRSYYESLSSAFGTKTAAPAQTPPPPAQTLSNKLSADPPNERRQAISFEDRRKMALDHLAREGWRRGD